jgi:hypothetical protein
MANSTSNVDAISASQSSKEVTANNFFDAASQAITYGRRGATSSGLTWGYYGGNVRISAGTMSQIANGTLTLTGSTTNYIVAAKTNGAVSVSTTTTNWDDSANYWRLYSVVAGSATVTSWTDARLMAQFTQDPGSGGGGVSDGDKGDITVSGSGATWTIDSQAVTLAKMANIATDSLIGRDTAGTGVPEAITLSGGIEFSGSGSIRTSAFTGDVTKTAGGTALTIANDAVTYAKMQNVSATDRLLGRSTAGAGDVEEIVCTSAARSILDDATIADILTTLTLASSTYTPTSSNVSNIDASTTFLCRYYRHAAGVRVYGQLNVDATAAAANAELTLTLPIAPSGNFTLIGQASGGVAGWSNTNNFGVVAATVGAMTVTIRIYVTSGTGNQVYQFWFDYAL